MGSIWPTKTIIAMKRIQILCGGQPCLTVEREKQKRKEYLLKGEENSRRKFLLPVTYLLALKMSQNLPQGEDKKQYSRQNGE